MGSDEEEAAPSSRRSPEAGSVSLKRLKSLGGGRKANKKGCKADVDLGERSDSDADGAKVACNKCGEQTNMRESQQAGSRSEFPAFATIASPRTVM